MHASFLGLILEMFLRQCDILGYYRTGTCVLCVFLYELKFFTIRSGVCENVILLFG